MALPVDAFHMKTKHKQSDQFCGQFCNPVLWPDLWSEEAGWRFNSSAAEMTNTWIGGYQPIVREMRADRYDFFLDEMIKLKNRLIIKELERSKCNPRYIPREFMV